MVLEQNMEHDGIGIYVDRSVLELLDQMNDELEEGQKQLTTHVLEGDRRQTAIENLFFCTSCTPPERATNQHLQRFAALFGFTVPSPKELLGRALHNMKAQVEVGTRPLKLSVCDVK